MMALVVGLAATVTPRLGFAQPGGESPAQLAARLTGVGSVVGGGPQWSPDGMLYYPSSLGGAAVWSVDPRGGPPRRVAPGVSGQLLRLAPGGDRLAYLSAAGGNPEIWLYDLTAGRARQLTWLGGRINALDWSPDGRALAISALVAGQFDLWRIDATTGDIDRLTRDPAYETYPRWTPDGRSLVFVRSDDRWADHDVMIMPAEGGATRRIAADVDLFDYGTIGTRARFGYPLISPDGRQVAFRSHRSGWLNYWVVPIGGGAARAVAPEAADQSDGVWSPDGRRLAFVSNRNGTVDLRVASVAGASIRIVVPVETGVVAAPAWAADGRTIAYTLATPRRPADLYVVSADGGAPTRLTVSIDPADEARLVTPRKVRYQSDAFEISAYLYRSSGVTDQAQPGILYIHGGPTGQFSDTYLAQAQFLAAMGYVVLAPNIRGSSGYGKAFEDANNPCWTHCDLRDVVAGAEYLKTVAGVDSSRLAITGSSYGGIMSMGAVAHAPTVFHAAVPQSGYADWISFQDYNTELQHTKLLAYEWGPYPDSAHVYRRNSSIFSAERVIAPVFLVDGKGQQETWRPGVYPIPASLEFAHALDRLNKVVRYKTYSGETYYVRGRANRAQVMLDIADFLAQYLRSGGTPAGPHAMSTTTPAQR